MEQVTWIDDITAVVDSGTMLIHARSGKDEGEWRMSLTTFRRYAEQGLRDLNTFEHGTRVLPFGVVR